jgi:hypothetical protein
LRNSPITGVVLENSGKEAAMKRSLFIAMTLLLLGTAGCATKTGSAAGGVVVGAAGGSGTYEYRLNEEMKRIEEEYKAGKMDQREYEIRKDQIERLSYLQ